MASKRKRSCRRRFPKPTKTARVSECLKQLVGQVATWPGNDSAVERPERNAELMHVDIVPDYFRADSREWKSSPAGFVPSEGNGVNNERQYTVRDYQRLKPSVRALVDIECRGLQKSVGRVGRKR